MEKLIVTKTVVKSSKYNFSSTFFLTSDKLQNKEFCCHKEEMFTLGEETTKCINNLSEELKTTNFITLLSAFYVFLYRYTNKSKVCLITSKPEKKRNYLINFFNDSIENLNCIELLRQIANGYGIRCQIITPTFKHAVTNVGFVLMPTSSQKEALFHEITTMNLDFSVVLVNETKTISGFIKYNNNVFDTKYVQRMSANFLVLLRSICENTHLKIGELKAISAEEQKIVLEDFNKTHCEPSGHKSFVELFEEKVIEFGKRKAIVEKKVELNYEQLNKKANQFAHFLEDMKLSEVCAVLLPQSVDFVTASIAILKSGRVCVPLSANNSAERLTLLLDDLNYPTLITRKSILNKNGLNYSKTLFCDEENAVLSSKPEANLNIKRKTTDLAYIMFTSGSTGKPKGVLLEYKSLTNVILWFAKYMSLSPSDRCSLVANPAFDAHITEIWPQLITGSSLHVCPKKIRHNSHQIMTWLRDQQINLAFLPTAIAIPIIGDSCDDTSLRKLIIGGEKLNRFPHPSLPFEVINGYGPTENSVISTFMNLSIYKTTTTTTKMPSVGKAIDGVKLFVLNRSRQPVPIGVPGELYIGGEGVSRGYLNNAKLNNELFVDSPIPQYSGRLYKTGDLVSWTEEGNLVYKGRLKHELRHEFRDDSEIERIVAQHPSISHAIVNCTGDRTTCYCTLKSGCEQFSVHQFRKSLKKQISPHLLPFNLIFLSHFPLTSNGKVSKKSLPDF